MKTYQVGIIGCGRVASLLEKDTLRAHPCTHAGAFAAIDRCELVAGCDIDPGRLAEFGATWNIGEARLYDDYRRMLKNEKLDIVCISTWTHLHAEMTIAAARTPGMKAILCEKPLAATLADARAMLNECRRRGVLLAVNHGRRYDGTYQGVKQFIDAGGLGEIKTVAGWMLNGRPKPGWHTRLKIAGGGPLMHDGTHMVDIIRYLLGDYRWVEADVTRVDRKLEIEDRAMCWFELKNGVKGLIESGGGRNYFHFELDIHGSDGRIQIGNGIARYFKADTSRQYEGFRDLILQDQFVPVPHQGLTGLRQIREIITSLEKKTNVISTGDDAYRALEFIFAAYHSASIGGKRVSLPLIKLKRHPLATLFNIRS